ncbi:hypothetical protein PENTCL1PPCAC_1395, partial [Pristionchus entomophagus]
LAFTILGRRWELSRCSTPPFGTFLPVTEDRLSEVRRSDEGVPGVRLAVCDWLWLEEPLTRLTRVFLRYSLGGLCILDCARASKSSSLSSCRSGLSRWDSCVCNSEVGVSSILSSALLRPVLTVLFFLPRQATVSAASAATAAAASSGAAR